MDVVSDRFFPIRSKSDLQINIPRSDCIVTVEESYVKGNRLTGFKRMIFPQKNNIVVFLFMCK